MLTDLKKYKDHIKSKTIVEELSVVIQILNLTLTGLKLFDYYAPVKDLMGTIKDAKTVIEIHKNSHERLVENKGNEKE